MIISDLPPSMPPAEVRIYCSVEASTSYGLPPELLYAVAVAEGGTPGLSSQNSNGTADLGYMQFNTAYLKTLEKFGIKAEDVQQNSCYPFHLAAWRIRGHLEEPGPEDLFTKAAYYHSRTPEYNAIYRDILINNAQKFDFKRGAFYLRQMTLNIEEDLKKQEQSKNQAEPLKQAIAEEEQQLIEEASTQDQDDELDDVEKAILELKEHENFYIPME